MRILKGNNLIDSIDALGLFRIEAFREYPYLYDGTLDFEREYLSKYLKAEKSIVMIIEDDKGIAGACTGIPLIEERNQFKAPLEGDNIEKFFYIGEIMIRKDSRGKNIGKKLFDEFLSQIDRSMYPLLCAYTVRRNDGRIDCGDFAAKKLLSSKGFSEVRDRCALISWKDIDQLTESTKEFDVWVADNTSSP